METLELKEQQSQTGIPIILIVGKFSFNLEVLCRHCIIMISLYVYFTLKNPLSSLYDHCLWQCPAIVRAQEMLSELISKLIKTSILFIFLWFSISSSLKWGAKDLFHTPQNVTNKWIDINKMIGTYQEASRKSYLSHDGIFDNQLDLHLFEQNF